MRLKALARYLYANVYGLAAFRFAAKDFTARYFRKPEFRGVPYIANGSDLIIDIGANRGQSIRAFRHFAPQAYIVAFEPEPRSVARLQIRYGQDPTVTIHECALASSFGSLNFFIPAYGLWDCDGMSSTDYKEATDWLRDPDRMLFYDQRKLSVRKHLVESRSLDSFGLAPALVKVHAQGAELDILTGAQRTIEQHCPALMVAFPQAEVNNLLSHWGYRPYAYRSGYFKLGYAGRRRTFTWYLKQQHLHKVPVRG